MLFKIVLNLGCPKTSLMISLSTPGVKQKVGTFPGLLVLNFYTNVFPQITNIFYDKHNYVIIFNF